MRPSPRALLALAVAAALVAPLLPAAAAGPAPAAPLAGLRVERAGVLPVAAALSADPGPASLLAWERSLGAALTGAPALRAAAGSSAALPAEPGGLDAVSDVDGDRRPEVLELGASGTVVRSGRTGAVLGRRPGQLVGLGGTGRVRLLEVDGAFEQTAGGYSVTLALTGLDGRLRPVWQQRSGGTVREAQTGSGGAALLDAVPLVLGLDRALLLGALSGGAGPLAGGTLQVQALDLQTGALREVTTVTGAGATLPSAGLVGALGARRDCLTTVAPAGTGVVVGLLCDGAPAWSAPVDLGAPYVAVAGRFPGDAVPDLLVSDTPFQTGPPRGSRVLSGADGTPLATSALSELVPLGVDASGDGLPDVQRALFEEGLAVEGLTLAGRRLYRREARLSGSGGVGLLIGVDLSGDAVPDALLTAQPSGGPTTTAVVEGRRGGLTLRKDVDGLLLRGVRGKGVDLLVRDLDRGRLRVTALEAVGARVLRRSSVPAPAGAVGAGAVTAAHLDGDGRRDLVVVSRAGGTRLLSALAADGRVLWQQRSRAAAPPSGDGGSVSVG